MEKLWESRAWVCAKTILNDISLRKLTWQDCHAFHVDRDLKISTRKWPFGLHWIKYFPWTDPCTLTNIFNFWNSQIWRSWSSFFAIWEAQDFYHLYYWSFEILVLLEDYLEDFLACVLKKVFFLHKTSCNIWRHFLFQQIGWGGEEQGDVGDHPGHLVSRGQGWF